MSRVHGTVVISGANRGVGFELTKSLIRNKNVQRVYAGCRCADKAEALQSLFDPEHKLRLLELDVAKEWGIKTAMEAVKKESGHVNLLINNAAILEKENKAGIPGGDRVTWLKHFDINVVSHAMMIQEFLPLLQTAVDNKQTATIVNISGLKGSCELGTGTEAVHGNIAYMCSKAALNKLTKTLSIELPQFLTVSVCPGWNRTSMGGPSGLKEPSETAPVVLQTVDSMNMQHSGGFWDRKGERIPY